MTPQTFEPSPPSHHLGRISGFDRAYGKSLCSTGKCSFLKNLFNCGRHVQGTPSLSKNRREQWSCYGSWRLWDPLLVSPRGSSFLGVCYSAKLAGLSVLVFTEDPQREEDLTSSVWITRHSLPCGGGFRLISCMVLIVSSEILSMCPLRSTAVEHTGTR